MISISIVSHGHSLEAKELLKSLVNNSYDLEVILTINSPDLECTEWLASLQDQTQIRVVRNANPKGFAENHNNAAKISKADYFFVLNPDVRLLSSISGGNSWDQILHCLQVLAAVDETGISYPVQVDALGNMLDFERALVTPWQLVLRYIGNIRYRQQVSRDWISGSCMMFRLEVFRKLGGFDERYRLYCEDVDICLRLQSEGYQLVRAPCVVVHNTKRQTLKSHQHLAWHLESLAKLWFSKAFWKYLMLKASAKFSR